MAKEEKSWKKRTEKLSKEAIQLSDRIEAYLSELSNKKAPRKSGGNPRIFEELVLRGICQMVKLQIETLSRLDAFQWMSEKRWWIGMFTTFLITVFVAIILQ
jgi:hypothetical protein